MFSLIFIFCSWIFYTECMITIQLKNYIWNVQNLRDDTIKTTATIPSGIYSDLRKGGILHDLFYRLNEKEYRWVANDDWMYSVNFDVDEHILRTPTTKELIFHGLDGTSTIFLNNETISRTRSTFIRYRINVTKILQEHNELQIKFDSPIRIANDKSRQYKALYNYHSLAKNNFWEHNVNYLRRMQASFGTQWAPIYPSVGIWKEAELIIYENVEEVIIRDLLITTEYKESKKQWEVGITVVFDIHANSQEEIPGNLNIEIFAEKFDFFIPEEVTIKMDPEYAEFIVDNFVNLDEGEVERWWPVGYGLQKLYKITATFSANNSNTKSTKSIMVGFRTVKVINDIIENKINIPASSFYFQVNDIPIFVKGFNILPISIFPEKASDEKEIDYLLESALKAHTNMIRIPGVGIYQSDYFYQQCDKYGILIWQDMMFSKEMFPAYNNYINSSLISAEISQQIMRLQYHPSIVIWAGNDEIFQHLYDDYLIKHPNQTLENEYQTLVNIFREKIKKYDKNRPYVDTTPFDDVFSHFKDYRNKNVQNRLSGNVHEPETKWKNTDDFYIPRFSILYGIQSMPSLDTLKKITNEDDLSSYNTDFMLHRQRLHENVYEKMIYSFSFHFGTPKSSDIENLIYSSQINQAWAIKLKVDRYRKWKNLVGSRQGYGYTRGILYWSLNDVWQVPSSSSIEYGGKWKMLHYYAQKFFAPISSYIEYSLYTYKLYIYLISDLLEDTELNVKFEIFHWHSLNSVFKIQKDSVLLEKDNSKKFTDIDINKHYEEYCGKGIRGQCLVKLSLIDKKNRNTIHTNYLLPAVKSFQEAGLIEAKIEKSVKYCDSKECKIEITTETIALFVWLDTGNIKGYFSDNGFILTESKIEVSFYPKEEITIDDLKESLKIQVMDKKRLQAFYK